MQKPAPRNPRFRGAFLSVKGAPAQERGKIHGVSASAFFRAFLAALEYSPTNRTHIDKLRPVYYNKENKSLIGLGTIGILEG